MDHITRSGPGQRLIERPSHLYGLHNKNLYQILFLFYEYLKLQRSVMESVEFSIGPGFVFERTHNMGYFPEIRNYGYDDSSYDLGNG